MAVYLVDESLSTGVEEDEYARRERPLTGKRSRSPLRTALKELLEGPSEEERALGCRSVFSSRTSELLRGVTIEEGRAIVDLFNFSDKIPGVSTSTASTVFLGQLTRTIAQFENITEIEFRMEGSCRRFFRQIESSCQVIPVSPSH